MNEIEKIDIAKELLESALFHYFDSLHISRKVVDSSEVKKTFRHRNTFSFT